MAEEDLEAELAAFEKEIEAVAAQSDEDSSKPLSNGVANNPAPALTTIVGANQSGRAAPQEKAKHPESGSNVTQARNQSDALATSYTCSNHENISRHEADSSGTNFNPGRLQNGKQRIMQMPQQHRSTVAQIQNSENTQFGRQAIGHPENSLVDAFSANVSSNYGKWTWNGTQWIWNIVQLPARDGVLPRADWAHIGPPSLETVQVHHRDSSASTKLASHGGQEVSNGVTKKRRGKGHKRTAAGETWVDSTLDDWPSDDFRIFVGDLASDATSEDLTAAFCKYPSFNMARVVLDKRTGECRGYGFVSFAKGNDMVSALREMNGKYIGNRPVKLKKSSWQKREVRSGRKVK